MNIATNRLIISKIVLLVSIIIILGAFIPGASSRAQPARIPHENPATAATSWENAALLLSYSDIVNLTASQKYEDAQAAITELAGAKMPEGLQIIHARYKNLCQQQLTSLNDAESLLAEASAFFSNQQIGAARDSLNKAETTLQETATRLAELEMVTRALGDHLGARLAPTTSQLRQAYDRLNSSLVQLRRLVDSLSQLHESLAENPQAAIATSFYRPTSIELSAPAMAYPALPFTLSGRVSSDNTTVDRTISVLMDDTLLAEKTTPGRFIIEITPPGSISSGIHRLTVSVPPIEHYSGASETQTINISRLPVYLDIRTPALVFLPRTVKFSGKAYHEFGPLADAGVTFRFGNLVITSRTSSDGSFTAAMPVANSPATSLGSNPFYINTNTGLSGASLLGLKTLTINLTPGEPWVSPLETETQVFILNTANAIWVAILLILAGLLIYRTSRGRRPAGEYSLRVEPAATPDTLPAPDVLPGLPGLKNRIIASYRQGRKVMEKISGAVMTPGITLREFLKMTAPASPKTSSPFTELTGLAEIALYAARAPLEDSADRAESLAATIRKEVSDEPP